MMLEHKARLWKFLCGFQDRKSSETLAWKHSFSAYEGNQEKSNTIDQ